MARIAGLCLLLAFGLMLVDHTTRRDLISALDRAAAAVQGLRP